MSYEMHAIPIKCVYYIARFQVLLIPLGQYELKIINNSMTNHIATGDSKMLYKWTLNPDV